MSTPYEGIGAELREAAEVALTTDHEIGLEATGLVGSIVRVVLSVLLGSAALQRLIDERVNALVDTRVRDYLATNPPTWSINHVYVPHAHEASTIPHTRSVPVHGYRWWLFAIGGAIGCLLGVVLNLVVNATTVDTTTAGTLTHLWATAVDEWWFKISTCVALALIGAAALGSIRVVIGYDNVLEDVHVDVHENGRAA